MNSYINEPFSNSFYYMLSSEYKNDCYILFFPVRWIKSDTSFEILITISQNIDTLKSSAISYSKIPISFSALIPFPNLTKYQSNSTSNSKRISIKISLILNSPVSFGPKSHSISHASSWVSHSGSEVLGAIIYPLV